MRSSEQIEKLLSKLIELTEKDKVGWQETANLNTFLAPVGEFVVTVEPQRLRTQRPLQLEIMDGRAERFDGTKRSLSGRREKIKPAARTGSA